MSLRALPALRALPCVLALLTAVGLGVGCDSTEISPLGFDPFDTDDGVLSVYGYLETGTFGQTVRVQLLRRSVDRPMLPEDAAVDAVVTTELLDTGAQRRWVPRLVQFADSTYSEVYEASFEPRPGETYRLTVERGTDRAVAEVAVPPIPRPTRIEDGVPGVETVVWTPVTRITTTRFVARVGCGQGAIPLLVEGAIATETTDGTARMTLDLAAVQARIDAALGVDTEAVREIAEFILTPTVADDTWTLPADTSDLAQPGANSNVEGGYGRFGAVTRGFIAWKPDARVLEGLRLTPCP